MEFPVITICGSMRFYPAMIQVAKQLTHHGFIVLVPFDTKEDMPLRAETDTMLDDMHKVKIEMADLVLIVSNGGHYIGESTASEIDHAKKNGKATFYMSCDEIFDGTIIAELASAYKHHGKGKRGFDYRSC